MNSQDFLTLNLVGAGAFLFWYLLSRGGPRRPTQLDLKAPDSNPVLLEKEKQEPGLVRQAFDPAPRVKSLNVMFNYNGHSWDAYEVLGLPAGAPIHLVTEAFQNAISRCDKSSIDFLETAYKSILHRGG